MFFGTVSNRNEFAGCVVAQKFEKNGRIFSMSDEIKIQVKNVNVFYGDIQALFDVNLDIKSKEITSLIGPSGCGKSTFFSDV